MKKILLVPVLAILMLTTSCSKDILTDAEIPVAIMTYISTHFPSETILLVEKELELGKRVYEVNLSGNTMLEFDKAYNVTSIEGTARIPDSALPQTILDYVTANFASSFVTDWDLKPSKQDVYLNNGLELVFDKNGAFLRLR